MDILTIIVPVINCFKYTRDLIGSIETEKPYRIILIDNGSTDETQNYFGERDGFPNLHYFRFKENLGVAGSWNFGIKYGIERLKSKHFLILNNDILLHPKAIDVILDTLEKPEFMLVSGFDVCGKIAKADDVFTMSMPKKSEFKEQPQFCCFAIKKETIDQIGYFDSKFYPAYFEDNDYHYRINLAKFKAVSDSRALYYHYGSRTMKSSPELNAKINIGFTINREYYREKWGGTQGNEQFLIPFGKML